MKAVKVMHTVALRTEATTTGNQKPPANLGQVFKVFFALVFENDIVKYSQWFLLFFFY